MALLAKLFLQLLDLALLCCVFLLGDPYFLNVGQRARVPDWLR